METKYGVATSRDANTGQGETNNDTTRASKLTLLMSKRGLFKQLQLLHHYVLKPHGITLRHANARRALSNLHNTMLFCFGSGKKLVRALAKPCTRIRGDPGAGVLNLT